MIDAVDAGRRASVLIVDDSATNRQKLAIAVGNLGHDTAQATDGVEALERIVSAAPDLVILDIMMPHMDGFEVLERMAADTDIREIPVLVISSLEEMADVVRAIELGATDFLTKSFNPVLLRARVSACLDRKRLRDQELGYLREVNRLTDAAHVVEAAGFDPDELGIDALAGRPDALGDLARVFRRMAGEIHSREVFYRHQITLLKGAFLLLLTGIPFGLVPTLSRIAAAEGFHPIAISAWVILGSAITLVTVGLVRRRLPRVTPDRVGYALQLGMLGTALPQIVIFTVAAHLPASVIAIVLALESVLVFLLASLFRIDRPDFRRFVGLCLGLLAVLLVVASDGVGVESVNLLWVVAAIIAPVLYAGETVVMSAASHRGDDPIEIVMLMMMVSAVTVFPLAWLAGILPPPSALFTGGGWAVPAMSVISAGCTVLVVVTVRQTGAVFASQYTVPMTVAGVVWAMLILGEALDGWIWLSLGLMLASLLLVRPRTGIRAPSSGDQFTRAPDAQRSRWTACLGDRHQHVPTGRSERF